MLRSSKLNNVERGCQPSILSRLFNDESCSANCIKKLAWFISKAFDKRHKCMPVSYTHLTLPTSDLV